MRSNLFACVSILLLLSSSVYGQMTAGGSRVTDSTGNVWTVVDGKVEENGLPAGYTANVVALVYSNDRLYQKNSAGTWRYWNGKCTAGDPHNFTCWTRAAAPVATGSSPVSTSTVTTPITTTSTTTAASGSSNGGCMESNNGNGHNLCEGVNLSGMEWGGNQPGQSSTLAVPANNATPQSAEIGLQYAPTEQEYSYYAGKGMTLIRLPFLWEYLQPWGTSNNTSFYKPYDTELISVIQKANAAGLTVLIDCHNYGRYYNQDISTNPTLQAVFANLWQQIATDTKGMNVYYDLMNEPHDLADNNGWVTALNGAITAIRGTGATNPIFVEGLEYASAGAWQNNTAPYYNAIKDSANNLVFEAHQYFDSAYSGDANDCGNGSSAANIQNAIQPWMSWLQQKKAKGFLGEFNVSTSSQCQASFTGLLTSLQQHSSDVVGWSWWAGGVGWGGNTSYGGKDWLDLDPNFNTTPPTDSLPMKLMSTFLPAAGATASTNGTATGTPSVTPTATGTTTDSGTPSITPTVTGTTTDSGTPSVTPTVTGTTTDSGTPGVTPTATSGAGITGTGPLSVSGTSLVTKAGSRFIFKGVNLEYFRDPGGSSISTAEVPIASQMIARMKSIGINAVRLDYTPAFVDQGHMTDYLAMMKLLASNGMYVMPCDHSYTGKPLTNYTTTSFPDFKTIIDYANQEGITDYLIMNPYNEPYNNDDEQDWITANEATLKYLRTTLGFKGVVVLDTAGYATSDNTSTFQTTISYDASLQGGKSNIVFSNHWYPTYTYQPTLTLAKQYPLVIGEIGQTLTGSSSGANPAFVTQVSQGLRSTGIPNGHNGAFPWIWWWTDGNQMTDDGLTLNTYGQLIATDFYSKTSGQ
jgi:endoglucanase